MRAGAEADDGTTAWRDILVLPHAQVDRIELGPECEAEPAALRHALRTSLVAFVTLFGLDFGALVGGSALLTEVVFGLQGVGKLTYDALLNLDLPIIMTTVLYASFFVVMANAVVDILYMLIDPRVRTA